MEHGKQRRSHIADLICHGSATESLAVGAVIEIVADDQLFVHREAIDSPLHQLSAGHSGQLHKIFYEPRVHRAQLDVEVHRLRHKWIIGRGLWLFRGMFMVVPWVKNLLRKQMSASGKVLHVCNSISFSPEVTPVQYRRDLQYSSKTTAISLLHTVGGIVFNATENKKHRDSPWLTSTLRSGQHRRNGILAAQWTLARAPAGYSDTNLPGIALSHSTVYHSWDLARGSDPQGAPHA